MNSLVYVDIDFEAFGWAFLLSANLLFLKSAGLIQDTIASRECLIVLMSIRHLKKSAQPQ